MRDDRWVIPDLVGKRKKLRLVPVPGWVNDRFDLWMQAGKIAEGGKYFGRSERMARCRAPLHHRGLENRAALRSSLSTTRQLSA
jgi:hypothetical protein